LQGPDFVLLHIHGAEYKVHHLGDFLGVGLGVHHHQLGGGFGHGLLHGPAMAHGLAIGLAGAAGAGGQRHDLKPGVAAVEADEPLAHHAGGADDADFVLVHSQSLHFFAILQLGIASRRKIYYTITRMPDGKTLYVYAVEKQMSLKATSSYHIPAAVSMFCQANYYR